MSRGYTDLTVAALERCGLRAAHRYHGLAHHVRDEHQQKERTTLIATSTPLNVAKVVKQQWLLRLGPPDIGNAGAGFDTEGESKRR